MNHILATKLDWQSLSWTSKCLVSYGVLMLMALILTYLWSLNDHRLIRDVGVWVKPMKFMAATSLYALTTVWVLKIANSNVEHSQVFVWITALLISTSL